MQTAIASDSAIHHHLSGRVCATESRALFELEIPPVLTRWARLRLRAVLWRQWKTPRHRRAALMELGVRPRLANNTAGSGLGPWYLARAKARLVGLSNAHFNSLGLPTLIDGA